MDLEPQLTAVKQHGADLPLPERALLACRLAKQLEKAGDYERAGEALNEFWPDREQTPQLDALDDLARAEVLLRVGALAGWQGGAQQREGRQETAKDLITQSIEIFERLHVFAKAAEARGDLALCYWREGAFDEARVQLRAALHLLPEDNHDLKAILLIRAGIIEERTRRLHDALRLYNEAAPLVEGSKDHALKGSFHFEYGLVLRRLSAPEKREEYLDRALIEYAASSFHYEQAGNERALARVELNLGHLFFTIGKYPEAHHHLNLARHLFLKLKDAGTAAQVDDTRARTLLAEGHVPQAERIARQAIRVLERGDSQSLLAEALNTQGVALARLGNFGRAKATLERAIEVAETVGDLEGAGRAKLSIIEELEATRPAKELVSIYRAAIDLLKDSQDPSTGKRLIKCADKLLGTVGRLELSDHDKQSHSWEGFSLKEHVQAGEEAVIERALRDAGGSVTKAAHLLGFKHHQSLISLLNTRHKKLLNKRSAIRKRRQHLFSKSKSPKPAQVSPTPAPETSMISILHIEDNEAVARTVADVLTGEGMNVGSCVDGLSGLRTLKSKTPYDVIIIDNDLPEISGFELIGRLRKFRHRRNTPIIMLSGSNIEEEAWQAGVSAFLRKPEGVNKIGPTIKRLLQEQEE